MHSCECQTFEQGHSAGATQLSSVSLSQSVIEEVSQLRPSGSAECLSVLELLLASSILRDAETTHAPWDQRHGQYNSSRLGSFSVNEI